ncbi:hypothetical protein Tco_1483020 [Tanacetum coccineum]
MGTPPLLPIPLPTSSPPLHLLSTDHRADRPEVTLLPRKRLGIALDMRYEVGKSSSAPTARPPGGFRADYGFVSTMDREIMRDLERDVGYEIIDIWDEMLDMVTRRVYVRLDVEPGLSGTADGLVGLNWLLGLACTCSYIVYSNEERG